MRGVPRRRVRKELEAYRHRLLKEEQQQQRRRDSEAALAGSPIRGPVENTKVASLKGASASGAESPAPAGGPSALLAWFDVDEVMGLAEAKAVPQLKPSAAEPTGMKAEASVVLPAAASAGKQAAPGVAEGQVAAVGEANKVGGPKGEPSSSAPLPADSVVAVIKDAAPSGATAALDLAVMSAVGGCDGVAATASLASADGGRGRREAEEGISPSVAGGAAAHSLPSVDTESGGQSQPAVDTAMDGASAVPSVDPAIPPLSGGPATPPLWGGQRRAVKPAVADGAAAPPHTLSTGDPDTAAANNAAVTSAVSTVPVDLVDLVTDPAAASGRCCASATCNVPADDTCAASAESSTITILDATACATAAGCSAADTESSPAGAVSSGGSDLPAGSPLKPGSRAKRAGSIGTAGTAGSAELPRAGTNGTAEPSPRAARIVGAEGSNKPGPPAPCVKAEELSVETLLALPSDSLRPIRLADFERAAAIIMPSDCEGLTARYGEWNERYGSGADAKRQGGRGHKPYATMYM